MTNKLQQRAASMLHHYGWMKYLSIYDKWIHPLLGKHEPIDFDLAVGIEIAVETVMRERGWKK